MEEVKASTTSDSQGIVVAHDFNVNANNGSNGEMFASTIKERDDLKIENVKLREDMKGMIPMKLSYQNYIPGPPVAKNQLWGQACANDTITVTTWMDTWLKNMAGNKKWDWKANSAYNEFAKFAYRPVIVAGSGPSLKKNAHLLKDRPKEIGLVSCLHNFGYFEDLGVHPDYYLNLDAGEITISEMGQGGKKSPEYYWEASKEHKLLTAVHCLPKLHEMWKGDLLWYRTIMPHPRGQVQAEEIAQGFDMFMQVGGNALGACFYFARAVLGCNPTVFVGADFAFGYEHKFHPFDSPYDAQFSGVIPETDVFGNRVYTWQSYKNFSCWFNYQFMGGEGNNPGLFINCTEGGILGAYHDGNIQQILQIPLEQFIKMYTLHTHLPECMGKKMLLF